MVVGDILDHDAAVVADKIGKAAVACRLDVASADDWGQAIALGLSTFGQPVRGMVNNAGISITFEVISKKNYQPGVLTD